VLTVNLWRNLTPLWMLLTFGVTSLVFIGSTAPHTGYAHSSAYRLRIHTLVAHPETKVGLGTVSGAAGFEVVPPTQMMLTSPRTGA